MRALDARAADELVHKVDAVTQGRTTRNTMPRSLSKRGVQLHVENRNKTILTAGAAGSGSDGDGDDDTHRHGRQRRHDDRDWYTEREEEGDAR